MSNSQEEWMWGNEMADAWNKTHPDQHVIVDQVPTRQNLDQTYTTSEEEILAAIEDGTAPCLVFNIAPVAVAQFAEKGGLVPLNDLPGGVAYVRERTGDAWTRYRSPDDDKLWQLPWKTNPVMVFYNREMFQQAGLDPDGADLATYSEFLRSARVLTAKHGMALAPSSSKEFYQSWFDFYPLWIAATGEELVHDGKAAFNAAPGLAVMRFWRTLFSDGSAVTDAGVGDPFADSRTPIKISGPWAIPSFAEALSGKWGVVPVPTPDGRPASQVWTFRDSKNVGVFKNCNNLGTAWDVLKFATSAKQDLKLLRDTWQLPNRADLRQITSEHFAADPVRQLIADQAERTMEGPDQRVAIEVWQVFRNAYVAAVITRTEDPSVALDEAASAINMLGTTS